MRRFLLILLSWPLLAVASPAVTPAAAAAAAPVASGGTGLAGQLMQTMLGLLAVVALIFALAWLMRRVQQAAPRSGQVIDVIGAKALGPRDRLVLVQVGEEQILLGISPGRITPLHVMNTPVNVPSKPEQTTPEFAQRLMELLGKDNKDKK